MPSSTSLTPPLLDAVAARRWQRIAAPEAPWLHEEVARRMAQRLQWLRLVPTHWAHWGAVRDGPQTQALLAQRYPQARCYLVDPGDPQAMTARQAARKPWWSPARWTGTAPALQAPPPDGVQLLWSNLQLQACDDPTALMTRWHETLDTDGVLMFSCLGPDTLRELRQLYASLGWPPPAQEFTDMHDWGDMLLKVGFAEPVMDMERITLTWSSPASLLSELRGLGRNLHPARFAGLRGRQWHLRLAQGLAEHLARPGEGALGLSFEIVYGHALKPATALRMGPQTTISLAQMRQSLSQSKRKMP